MAGNPFGKYSGITLTVVTLLLIFQCTECVKRSKPRGKISRDNGFDTRRLSNISSPGNVPDLTSSKGSLDSYGVSLPSLPKPGIVAYHRSLHNTSWAITIPLFTFLLPTTHVNNPLDVGNQALYGFFAAVIVIIGFAIPILFNGQVPGARSLESSKVSLNHLLHPAHLMNLVGLNIGNQIGIDPMQCLQKTVCEAYRSPQNERYGALAWPFQYFVPANNASDSELSTRSIYQVAAKDGKFTNADCKKKYQCLFDPLDLATYCLFAYQRSRMKAKENATSQYYSFDSDLSSDKISFR